MQELLLLAPALALCTTLRGAAVLQVLPTLRLLGPELMILAAAFQKARACSASTSEAGSSALTPTPSPPKVSVLSRTSSGGGGAAKLSSSNLVGGPARRETLPKVAGGGEKGAGRGEMGCLEKQALALASVVGMLAAQVRRFCVTARLTRRVTLMSP